MTAEPCHEFIPIQRVLGLTPDGQPGPKTLTAVALRLQCLALWPAVQLVVKADQDGMPGPATARAIAQSLGISMSRPWPTQEEVRSGLSIFGQPGDEGNLVSIVPPYPLYHERDPVKTIRVHQMVTRDVQEALTEILNAYGMDKIHALHLDQYGGSYQNRSTAGGKNKSMHAWGIALDFDPERNSYPCKAPHSGMSRPECTEWWRIWEAHGAVSQGREHDCGWMHLQFTNL